MDSGDIYNRHMRGSRFVFGNGKIVYNYPGGGKAYSISDDTELVNMLIKVKGVPSGRFFINEDGEITTYRKEQDCYIPYYVGNLEGKIEFEGLDNNPKSLPPGSLWTGFASFHGARFGINSRGVIRFKETTYSNGDKCTMQYRVQGIDEDLIDTILDIKQDGGAFRINEYGHVWAPVEVSVIRDSYDGKILDMDYIKKQFAEMTNEQKRTVNKYSQTTRKIHHGVEISWYPIYIGQFTGKLHINRPDKPHIIVNEDYEFPEEEDD